MTVGDDDYQLSLSKVAYNFNGAISMDYLENAPCSRISQLYDHSKVISEALNNG